MSRPYLAIGVGLLLLTTVWLAACGSLNEPDLPPELAGLNPTQQAIALILTRQAANPRPTRTPWVGANLLLTERAATPMPTATTDSGGTAVPADNGTRSPRAHQIVIVSGPAPRLDGVMAAGEWNSAETRAIPLFEDKAVTLYYQRDDAGLYIAFTGLDQTDLALFPELWLDAGFEGGQMRDENDWWFHVSTNFCRGTGANALWEQCGVTPQGWAASSPAQNPGVIEIHIPYATVGASPDTPVIGIGFGVMYLTAAGDEARTLWPETAVLSQPGTWAQASLSSDE